MCVNNTAKYAIVISVIVVAAIAFIAPAYSYSSNVNSNGNITSEYVTINIMNGEAAATSLNFNSKDWTAVKTTPSSFEIVPQSGNSYSVKVQSNKDTGSSPGAYMYGYFTGGGAGIKSIELALDGYGSVILYRDAPVNEYSLDNQISESVSANVWNMSVTTFTANCYEGLQVNADGTISVISSSNAQQSLSMFFTLDGLSIHMFSSWTSLTTPSN